MSKNNMLKMFNRLNYKHTTWEVYSDFIELSTLAINSAAQIINKGKNDKRYFEIMKRYSKEEFEIFPKLLCELVDSLETNPTDVLGELFMELDLGSKWKGQFFTPYNLCLLMAELAMGDIEKTIQEHGYVTLNEPCSGGGAMILAFAQKMRERGYNPQKQLMVICQDLDEKAVYMSYIQLSLMGIPAIICHMNTLTLEMYSQWKTPFWVLGNWDCKELRPKAKNNIKLLENDNGQLSFMNL